LHHDRGNIPPSPPIQPWSKGQAASDGERSPEDSAVLGSWKGIFIGDGDSFTQDFRQYDFPLTVCWESGLTAMQIENGAADSYLKSWAKEMAAYGHPIIFGPLDEMNGNWNAYSGDPNAFKAAWVRVYGFFAGVLNVQFAFGVYNGSVPVTADNGLTSYYPGGNFVDLVGVDGFNFGGQTWAQVFSGAL